MIMAYIKILPANMVKWVTFKSNKGKDFYRNSLEYFEYDTNSYQKMEDEEYIDDDEIAYKVAKKLKVQMD